MMYRIRLINPQFGVPASFVESGQCKQFTLVASATSPTLFTPTVKYENVLRHNKDGSTTKLHINCNQQATIAINTRPDKIYFTASNRPDKYLYTPYSRVIVEARNEAI